MSTNELRNRATASGGTDAQRDPRLQSRGDKGVTSVGTVNVTTLYAPGRLRCAIEEINRYSWDVLGLAETHWTGEGEIMIGDVKVLYSGRTDEVHREGVAFLLGKRAQKAYLSHRSSSSRIMSVTFRGHHLNTTMIQVYAPDTSHGDEDVEDFYQQLEDEVEKAQGNMVIVMGDFNSKIGNDNAGYEDVMGKFGLGERNERGERMLEFCKHNDFCITNTYFYHRMQHRYTWTHPDQIHKNCIDYVLIKRRWRSSVIGTKVMRGADFNTSHELLLSNIRVRFKTAVSEAKNQIRYNTEKLKEENTREEFRIRIGGRFEPLLQEVDNLEELWTTGKEAIKEEAMAVLGQRRVAKQDWATAEMLDACDEKRQAKRIKNTLPSEEN